MKSKFEKIQAFVAVFALTFSIAAMTASRAKADGDGGSGTCAPGDPLCGFDGKPIDMGDDFDPKRKPKPRPKPKPKPHHAMNSTSDLIPALRVLAFNDAAAAEDPPASAGVRGELLKSLHEGQGIGDDSQPAVAAGAGA